MRRRDKKIRICCLFLTGLLGLWGCSSPSSDLQGNSAPGTENSKTEKIVGDNEANLIYNNSMELQYARNFSVDYYEGGYKMFTTMDGTKLFLVPEGKETPDGLAEDVKVLHAPVENIYLVASGVMDMFCELDALDSIAFSGQKEDGWYIEKAREAMEQGEILYAGKYNKPDYELILSKGCTLVIENTMITHSPEVMEKWEDFGIPAFIEYSSYESDPLGRVEWIKFFGALTDREAEAEKLFKEQVSAVGNVKSAEKTDKTVAFFYITSNGLFQVRQSTDYIPKMIELAGGKYIFENLGDPESVRSTINLQAEEFYKGAKDADYIIYNSSIDGGIQTVDELLEKCEFLQEFKAVQEDNVWCTTNDMYQQSMSIGYMIQDIHFMLTGGGEEKMKYLFQPKSW